MATIKNYKKNIIYTAGPMADGTRLHERMSKMMEEGAKKYMDSYKDFRTRVLAEWPTEPRPNSDEEDID